MLEEKDNIIQKLSPIVKYLLKEDTFTSRKKIRPYFFKFSRETINRYQLFKLKKCIRHAYKNSPYYNKIFKENNIKPSDIKSFKDLRKIPPTKTEDLQNNPRSFFAVPDENFIKVFTTAGTTGKPKKAFFTKNDIKKIVMSTALGGKLLYNITKKDVIRISFEVGYGSEIWGNSYCMDKAYGEIIGALTLTTGRLSVQDELEIINDYKPNVFADVSSRVNYLTNEFKKTCDLKSLGIKKLLIGAEPTPDIMRKSIERAWDADVFIGYGTTESGLLMAGECTVKNGMHLSETNFFTEIVDPKTGEQLEDGEIGEILFTTFDREGMPLIRYKTHDLGRITSDICSCGLPLKKIYIKGRSDDLIPIGAGDNLFTRMFDQAIFSIIEIIDYQVQFDKKDGKDQITIIAESNIINDNISKKIIENIIKMPEIKNGIEKSKTVTMPIVKLVKPNTLDRKSIKFKRLIDNRNLYD